MEYRTSIETAKLMGVSPRRVQQMCKSGEIVGAVKKGRTWMVPCNILSDVGSDSYVVSSKKKPLPIGISDYKLAVEGYYYVDKTLIIRDFIDTRPKVSLFTRPRRFGKTLNMDMLRVFFEKTSEDTSVYFRDKLIWRCGREYTDYQGKYPVIFLSFKDVKCKSWEETYEKIKELVMKECQRHSEVSTSDKLSEYEKLQFNKLLSGEASIIEYEMSLDKLSLLFHKHYGKETIIIIDEYDTPIGQGHNLGFYDDVVSFMRNFFSGGLKDNLHLAYGFMTGILRVAKESIFSGLNNIKIYSILDEMYSHYFGFTEEEIIQLLEYYDAEENFDEVREWYDGYKFGNTDIYNPWSVINYVSDKCVPQAFWQATGSNDIIGEIIAAATPEIAENLHELLSGEVITTYVDTNVVYPEIQKYPYAIYSFLLLTGYLKISESFRQYDGSFMCNVAIPNKEISFVYEREVIKKMESNGVAVSIQQAIFSKDSKKLQELLEGYMIESVSAFDGVNESFYHGMMLGLCAVLSNRYHVRSNRESGFGRFDILLVPQIHQFPGFIFEFKYTKNESVELDKLADSALKQIDEKMYEAELKASGVEEIIKIGIAFRGKRAVVKRK